MVSNFDHMTIVVTDADEAVAFFALLGFELVRSVVISGPVIEAYMGVPGIEADHLTLVIPGSEPRQEVQLLHYHAPPVDLDGGSGNLARTGFNHVCFRVDDLEAAVAHLPRQRRRAAQLADGLPRSQARVPPRPERRRRRAGRVDLSALGRGAAGG